MLIFISIIVGILLFIILFDLAIARMYHYKRESHQRNPEDFAIPYEEIHIPISNNAHLYGWWILTSPDAPTLILVHGWGRNLSRMLQYIVHLRPLGYNLLAFDARNHGSSSNIKHPTVWTFSQDILTVINFIAESGRISRKEFGVIGLSIGGGAAINAASADNRVKSVITVGALSHPMDLMKLEFQKRNIPNFMPMFLFKYMKLRFKIDFDEIAPVNNIPNTSADILLIHGDNDSTVPLTHGQILERSGNKEKTQLWVVPGKGHSDCETHPEFWDKGKYFLQQALNF